MKLIVILLLGNLIVATPVFAFDWQSLWLNKNQRALKLLDQDPAEAATQFQDPRWQGVSHYRAGAFEEAVELFSENGSHESQYNTGNALARSGNLEEALSTYDELLKRKELSNALRENTAFNRDLVKKLIEQQKQQTSSENGNPSEQQNANEAAGQEGGGQSDENNDGESGQRSAQASQSGQHSNGQDQMNESNPQHSDQSDQLQAEAKAGQEADSRDSSPPETRDTALNMQQEPISEDEQATEQWLQRIKEEPDMLLRRKLQQTHQNQYRQIRDGGQPW